MKNDFSAPCAKENIKVKGPKKVKKSKIEEHAYSIHDECANLHEKPLVKEDIEEEEEEEEEEYYIHNECANLYAMRYGHEKPLVKEVIEEEEYSIHDECANLKPLVKEVIEEEEEEEHAKENVKVKGPKKDKKSKRKEH